MRIVVTGGTRSGKSAIAESLLDPAAPVTYVATAEVGDDTDLAGRVARHRSRRPSGWRTVEAVDVGRVVAAAEGDVLVDSVGTWAARRMDEQDLWREGALAGLVEETRGWFTDVAPQRTVVVVAEQVGQGVIGTDPGTRRWVDLVGEVTAALAERADRVLLAVAGRAVELPRWAPVDVHRNGAAARDGASNRGSDLAVVAVHGDEMVPDGAVDLAVNVIDQSPPPHVLTAIDRAHQGSYPDPTAARQAVAALTGLTEDHVVLLAGAAEGFWLVPHALRPRVAAVIHPTFTAADAALAACDIPVVHVPRDQADGWRLHPDRVPQDADLVVVGNPNNPTGTLDDPAAIAALCRTGRTVLVDEAFMDFVVDHRSSLAGRVDLPGLIVLRSVTKLWSVPGLRAGWAVTAPDVAARLRQHQQPWPVSSSALAAIVAAADDEVWRVETAEGVARRRQAMVARLRQVPGLVVHDGAANFVLLEVPGGPAVHRALLARGLAVRPSTFPLLPDRFLRVAVREPEVVESLARALEAILWPSGEVHP